MEKEKTLTKINGTTKKSYSNNSLDQFFDQFFDKQQEQNDQNIKKEYLNDQKQNLFDQLNKLYEQTIKIDCYSDSIEDWYKLKQNYYKMQLFYESVTAIVSYLIRSENKKTTETAIKQLLNINDRIRTLGEKLIEIRVKKQIADYCFSKK